MEFKPQIAASGLVIVVMMVAAVLMAVLAELPSSWTFVSSLIFVPAAIVFLTAWAIPAVIAVGGFLLALFRLEAGLFFSWIAVASLSVIPVWTFYAAATDCELTGAIKYKIERNLTDTEKKSLERSRKICPTQFTYIGEKTGRTVYVDAAWGFFRGGEVFFSDSRG